MPVAEATACESQHLLAVGGRAMIEQEQRPGPMNAAGLRERALTDIAWAKLAACAESPSAAEAVLMARIAMDEHTACFDFQVEVPSPRSPTCSSIP